MSRNVRGRVYECVRCADGGKEYLNEKRRMVTHILKVHLSLDQVPYYCDLCHYRSMEEGDLRAHFHSSGEHKRKTSQDERRTFEEMMVINQDAYLIGEADMRRKSKEESAEFYASRRRTDMMKTAAMEAGIREAEDCSELENILPGLLAMEDASLLTPLRQDDQDKRPAVLESPASLVPEPQPEVPTYGRHTKKMEPHSRRNSRSVSDSESEDEDCCAKLVPVLETLKSAVEKGTDLVRETTSSSSQMLEQVCTALQHQTAAITGLTSSINELVREMRKKRDGEKERRESTSKRRERSPLKENRQKSHEFKRRKD